MYIFEFDCSVNSKLISELFFIKIFNKELVIKYGNIIIVDLSNDLV